MALSLIVNTPVRVPTAVGVNATAIVQLDPAASSNPVLQVVPAGATTKSPLTAMLLNRRATLPVLVTIVVWLELVVPID